MKRSTRTTILLGLAVIVILGGTIVLRDIYRGPQTAEVVRITLGDRSYAIPTDLQPSLHGAPPALVEQVIVENRRRNTYVQPPGDPPAAVRSFSLGGEHISSFAGTHGQAASLQGVSQLIFLRAPGSRQDHEQRIERGRADAQREDDGPFLRNRFQDDSFVLYSRGPVLFGSSIEARCNPFGDTMMCDVRGRISEESRLRIMLDLSKHPIPSWPALFETLEGFVGMLTIPEGGN